MEQDDIAVTEMDVIEEAHLRIDALLIYLEKKGLGSVNEFESFFQKYVEKLEEE